MTEQAQNAENKVDTQTAENSENKTEQNEMQIEAVEAEHTDGGDPLEEAIARVQELQEALAAQNEENAKREQELNLRARAEIDNMRRRAGQDVGAPGESGAPTFSS